MMLPNADFNDCMHCACLAARKTAQRLTRVFDEKLRPHGLTINQFSMLTTLILAGPSTVSELAERLGIDRTTLTRNVALGEQRKLVSVSPGKDLRERHVAITHTGRLAAEAALPAWREAQAAEG
jgi:DNA-binding MarR family transcriptional regulator